MYARYAAIAAKVNLVDAEWTRSHRTALLRLSPGRFVEAPTWTVGWPSTRSSASRALRAGCSEQLNLGRRQSGLLGWRFIPTGSSRPANAKPARRRRRRTIVLGGGGRDE